MRVNMDISNKTEVKFYNNMIYLLNWQGKVIAKWPDTYNNMDRAYKAYEKEFYRGEEMVKQARRDRDYLHRRMIDKMIDSAYAQTPSRQNQSYDNQSYDDNDIYDTYFI